MSEHLEQRERRQWLLPLLLGTSVAVTQGFGRSTFALLVPQISHSIVHREWQIGALSSLSGAGFLIGLLALGKLGRLWAADRVLTLGVCTSTLGLFALSLGGPVSGLAIGMVLTGFGAALTYTSAMGIASGHRGRPWLMVGGIGTGVGVGILVSRAIVLLADRMPYRVAPFVGSPSGWRTVWLIEAAIGVLISVSVVLNLHVGGGSSLAAGRLAELRAIPHWGMLGACYLCYGISYSIAITFAVKMFSSSL